MTAEAFTARLAALMRQAGVSAESLAEKSGVGRSTMFKYLNGTRTPSIESARRIAVALGVSLSAFD